MPIDSFENFPLDHDAIQFVDRPKFEEMIVKEFTRDSWKHSDSRVLAWTNKTVVQYNHNIRRFVEGIPELQQGDYAICNQYMSGPDCRLKTDQLVQITDISPGYEMGVRGWNVQMDFKHEAFLPADFSAKKRVMAGLHADEKYSEEHKIENTWVDLRAAYSCTINKSQGSTYKKAFIDLDDVGKCRDLNQVARMLYVAVSRASEQVILTGEL